eukprot:scaffold33688_cov139-Skeletonema_dohrnii-CCMP3373.AAC.2
MDGRLVQFSIVGESRGQRHHPLHIDVLYIFVPEYCFPTGSAFSSIYRCIAPPLSSFDHCLISMLIRVCCGCLFDAADILTIYDLFY